MTRFSSQLLGSAALSLVLGAPTALANPADAADDDVYVQDEIVVVGQHLYSDQVNALKTPTPIIDVPQSLTIVTADQILERGFDSVADIVTYTPGVNATQGEGHRDAIVFRGVRSTADFFVDGVRDDVQYYRPLYNLEQVEILRGPNALLFGRGGTGGVLNRVTKKGDLDETFTGYQASIDSFGGFGGSVDTNFVVADNAALRINAYYESLDNHRDFYDGDNYGINPTARIALSPATTLDLSYEYANHERFIDRGIPTGTDGRPVEAFEDIVFGDPDLNTAEFEAHILRANLSHEFSDTMKGNFTVAYGDYDKLYQNFYASGYDQANTPDRVTLDGYVDTTERQRLTLSGNLVNEFAVGEMEHTLIIGGEYLDTGNDNDRFNARWDTTVDDNEVFFINRPLTLRGGVGVNVDGVTTTNNFFADGAINDRTQSDIKVYSLFIQDQIAINEYFDVVLGGRFDSFDQSSTNLKDLNNPVSASRTDEEFSPRLGLIYKPQENVSIYASYSEAFLPTSGEQFASTGSLDPDAFEQSEIGVKWDFVPGMSFTAAYFQNNQTTTQRDPDTEETFEEKGLEVEGFELQLQGQVTEQFFITAGYSYLEGETNGGAELPRELPEHMASIWGTYQITDKFGIGLGATMQDESFITDFDIGSGGDHPNLPRYTRFDAAAYYDISDDLRIQLNVENLTDELYFPSSHSTHQVTVGAPLNARLSISGRF
jgi:catecholate siderophore receptor